MHLVEIYKFYDIYLKGNQISAYATIAMWTITSVTDRAAQSNTVQYIFGD